MRACLYIAVAFAIFAGLSETAFADVQFTTIATSNTTNGAGLTDPSINNAGTVAYIDGNQGILFTGNGGPLTPVVNSPSWFTTPGTPGINDAGVVSFWAQGAVSGGNAILEGTQQSLSTVVSSQQNLTESPQIDDAGEVPFLANFLSGPNLVSGVFAGNGGGPAATIATFNTTMSGGTIIDPSISSQGTIAYEWHTGSGIPGKGGFGSAQSIYTIKDGVTTQVVDGNLPPLTHFAVNNAGVVAMTTDFGNALLVGNGAFLTSVPSPSPFLDMYTAVSINDSGTIAALGYAGESTIYVGTADGLTPLIAPGDPLDGSTVVTLGLSEQAINDRGEVAFWAQLANGEQGIYVATVPTPEPSSLLLFALAIGSFLAMSIRRLRNC